MIFLHRFNLKKKKQKEIKTPLSGKQEYTKKDQ